MRLILKNFHIIDEKTDTTGNVIIDDGIITGIQPFAVAADAAIIIDGSNFLRSGKLPVLMPAFVDLHAHFRDPFLSETGSLLSPELAEVSLLAEVLESASLAAAAGGFGTVVCMANTKPAIDSLEKVQVLKRRSDALGLIDLYPVMSLTKGMEGKELSGITALLPKPAADGETAWEGPLMLSEDGRDIADDSLFLAAMKEAKRIGIPVSCHCDFGGDEAEAAKQAGKSRSVWSRIEENNAVRRVIALGQKAGCHIHIAHVSTKEAVEMIRRAKAENFILTCEVMPHNLCLTEEDAKALGEESFGRVNPPLRSEDDRRALIGAAADGTIDVIATDHAPHGNAAKKSGAPGFSGLETAFAASFTELVRTASAIDLRRLSSLMSANPARLLGFGKGPQRRGRIVPGFRADLVIVDLESPLNVNPAVFKTRGKNSAFAGRELFGKILMTFHAGRVVFN